MNTLLSSNYQFEQLNGNQCPFCRGSFLYYATMKRCKNKCMEVDFHGDRDWYCFTIYLTDNLFIRHYLMGTTKIHNLKGGAFYIDIFDVFKGSLEQLNNRVKMILVFE